MPKFIQAYYVPVNPDKYIGDLSKIFCRSSYELVACRWLDLTPEIVKWNLEGVSIPYYDPVRDKMRIYIMDFVAQAIQPNGIDKIFLIEVKPKKQTKKPTLTSRTSQATYTAAVNLYLTNSAKWEAAKLYAENKGYKFLLWTEDDLLPGTKPIKRVFKNRKRKSRAVPK